MNKHENRWRELAEGIDRVLSTEADAGAANDYLDGVARRGFRLYVAMATEGIEGFDPRFANWKMTRTVIKKVGKEEEKVERPMMDHREIRRREWNLWEMVIGRIPVSSGVPRIDDGEMVLIEESEPHEIVITRPVKGKKRHKVVSRQPSNEVNYIDDPKRWRARAERYRQACRYFADLIEPQNGEADNTKPRGKRRNRRTGSSEKPLTTRQVEAMQLFGEHKGNIAAVAKAMGKDYSTAKQHISAAQEKLGRQVMKPKTRGMARDARGQETVASNDDGPGVSTLGRGRSVTERDRRQ